MTEAIAVVRIPAYRSFRSRTLPADAGLCQDASDAGRFGEHATKLERHLQGQSLSTYSCGSRSLSRDRPRDWHSRTADVLVAARTTNGDLINSEWRKHARGNLTIPTGLTQDLPSAAVYSHLDKIVGHSTKSPPKMGEGGMIRRGDMTGRRAQVVARGVHVRPGRLARFEQETRRPRVANPKTSAVSLYES